MFPAVSSSSSPPHPPHTPPLPCYPPPFLQTHRIGAIIALVGNEQVNQNVANINQEISSVIGELREYVNTSVYVSAGGVCVCE